MNAIAPLLMLLMIPLLVLNFFGGLVSGIWLLVIGDWRPVVEGFIGSLISIWLIAILLMPGLAVQVGAAALAEKGKTIFAVLLVLVSSVYSTALFTVYCLFVFWYFLGPATAETFIPLLIWSYGVALSPWMYMARKEEQMGSPGGEGFLIVFGQAAYILIALLVVFTRVTFIEISIIFAAIMGVSLLANVGMAYAIYKQQ